MDSFAPVSAACGGVLIGLAAALLWLANGRIAGVSGIFGRALPLAAGNLWRLAFVFGLVAGAGIASWVVPGLGVGGPQGRSVALVEAPSWTCVPTPLWLAAAGLLIGVGTRIGNGCTSGHGVCGLARLSPRSMAAVGVFFAVAIVTVAVTGVTR